MNTWRPTLSRNATNAETACNIDPAIVAPQSEVVIKEEILN
jgi:hypothetical protein